MVGTNDHAFPLDLPPGIEPRQYQFDAWAGARAAVAQGERPVIVAPTGSGKTVCFALITLTAVHRGSPVLWIAHRRELIFQARDRLQSFGLHCGLILAGFDPDPGAPVQVASIDTLRRRPMPPAKIVLLDECHRGQARTVRKVLSYYQEQGSAICGATATPMRADGQGLKPVFTALVETVTGDELRASGVLVPIRAFAPDRPDLSSVKTTAGDYNDEQSYGVMTHLSGRVVDTWLKHAQGRRTLVFACTIAHSRELEARFREAGVAVEHLDGETPNDIRAGIFRRLTAGETTVVCNCAVCVEGIDLPNLEAIVMARPTQSVTLFLQSVGRGVRCSPGKSDCLLLDHAGNCHRLGHPEEPRQWSLDGRPKKKKERKLAVCPQCGAVRRPKQEVCECGFRWPLSEIREFDESDEDLQEIVRGDRATMEQKAEAYAQLVRQARQRGYKIGWARHRYREQFGVWPRGMKQIEARHGTT